MFQNYVNREISFEIILFSTIYLKYVILYYKFIFKYTIFNFGTKTRLLNKDNFK